MARQYLAEGLKGSFPFIADTSKIVTESLPNGLTRTRIPGRFSVCDCVNGNGRRYGKRVWEKNFEQGSTLMQSIKENAAFGLLEHPKDGQVTLQSPICILTTAAKLQEGADQTGKKIWEVVGEISIVGTEEGKKLTALIEAGYNPRVSSRGFGSLVRATDGVDDVQDDYICEGWDVVMKPSFESAVLQPQRESSTAPTTESKVSKAAPISETVVTTSDNNATSVTTIITPGAPPKMVTTSPGTTVTLEAEEGSQAPTAGAAAPAKSTTESSQIKTMNINEIKTQIASFRGLDPSKLVPQRFAEGMSQLSALHQEVANFVAEDAKRSWQGQQLHDEIKAIENSWSESQMAPGKRASKLLEDNSKLIRVVKAVAQTALDLKNKIGESVKQQNRQASLLSEVTERGQAWMQRCKAMEAEARKYQRRFMMASEALHQFSTKYKKDVTDMGRAHLALEFKDKITPEIQKMLNEAVKPKALVPLRLALEGKITIETAKSILEGKISLDETVKSLKSASAPAPAKVEESKQTAAPPAAEGKKEPAAPAKGSPTAPVSEGVTIVSSKPGDPRELNEAVGMVSRLSKATTA